MRARIGYVNVYVSDLRRAVDFYQGVLGLPLLFLDEGFGYARLDAGSIYLGLAAVDRGADNFSRLVGVHTGISITVSDVDEAYRELSAKSVEFPMAPSDQPWGGHLALMADPDGNVLYLDSIADGA